MNIRTAIEALDPATLTAALDGLAALAPKSSSTKDAEDDGMVRRRFGVTVKAVNEELRTVDVVASNETIDSYGEIVEQDWDLSRYEKNPVVLFNHNQVGFLGPIHAHDLLPIGKSIRCKVVGDQLEATLSFCDEKANPMGPMVFEQFKQGSMCAVSVGFYPTKVEEDMTESYRGEPVVRLRGNVLCEISCVPMGANPDAVAEKSAQREQLRRLVARSKNLKAAPRGEEPHMDLQKQLEQAKIDLAVAESKAKDETAKAKSSADDAAAANEKVASLETALKAAEGGRAELVKTITEQKAATETALKKAAPWAGIADDAVEAFVAKGAAATVEALTVKLVEQHVESLIGTKLMPVEREDMTELALSNKKLFDKMVGGRQDLGLKGAKLGEADPKPASPPGAVIEPVKGPDGKTQYATSGGEGLAALMSAEAATA